MWIFTQNRERILSTDSLDEIRVSDPAPGKTDFAIIMNRRVDGKAFALGFYRKKDTAKRVLAAIIREQAKYITCPGERDVVTGRHHPAYVAVPPKTYEMPQDNELGD